MYVQSVKVLVRDTNFCLFFKKIPQGAFIENTVVGQNDEGFVIASDTFDLTFGHLTHCLYRNTE